MPRGRAQNVTQPQPQNVIKESKMAATELSPEMIAELLADSRTRGEYGDYLAEFISSGKGGIEVDFDDPRLAGKNVDKAYIGFNNAKKATIKDTNPPQLKVKDANTVRVVKKGKEDDQHLFLLRTVTASNES